MKVEDFDFNLPEKIIAQTPLKDRSSSRLMVLNREEGTIQHETFRSVKEFLKPGDCLVLNNTKVLPARVFGIKKDTGAKVEVLLLHQQEEDEWEVLVKPARKVKIAT